MLLGIIGQFPFNYTVCVFRCMQKGDCGLNGILVAFVPVVTYLHAESLLAICLLGTILNRINDYSCSCIQFDLVVCDDNSGRIHYVLYYILVSHYPEMASDGQLCSNGDDKPHKLT
jgi:hypothetical protein